MLSDGVEGFLFSPNDDKKALSSMETLFNDEDLRRKMSQCARDRFETTFDLDIMIESYRQLVMKVAPPVILLDMDGALIDWQANPFKLLLTT